MWSLGERGRGLVRGTPEFGSLILPLFRSAKSKKV